LVSNIEGPMEIINNGEFGCYFKKGDARDCADMILRIKSEYDNKRYLGQVNESYKYASAKFDIRNTALNYLKEYKKGSKKVSLNT